jgi:hypothetical protein
MVISKPKTLDPGTHKPRFQSIPLASVTATLLLIALCSAVASQVSAAEGSPQPPSTEVQDHSFFTKERAVVEDVLSTEENGYRSRAYIVTWHGSRVLVSDVLAESNKSVGDSIDFIASRYEVGGHRILTFISTERKPHRAAAVPDSLSSEDSSTTTGSTATASGVVEEVLGAQENGFRFIAYVVRSHDQPIAVSDQLALSHYAIGEQIVYLTLRSASPPRRLEAFQVQVSAADEKASITKPVCEIQPSRETGVVDQALFTDADGYRYRAYVVKWRGSKVVIRDPTATTNYQPGDTVSFWVSRCELTPPHNHKHQRFAFDRSAETTAVNQPSDLQTSSATDSAPVQGVLAAEVDGYRSVAYLVNWHNTPIAIIDFWATTHFGAGDRITFDVDRTTTPNMKGLGFMLFEFPTRPCIKPQSSSDNSTATVTAKTRASACPSVVYLK